MVSVLRAGCCALALLTAPAFAQAQIEAGDMTIEALPPQDLRAGECGMFLWSRTNTPMLVMVALDDPAEAKVLLNGRTRELRRRSFSGAPTFGHFEQQTFSDGRFSLEVDVDFDDVRTVRDGAIIRGGVLRTADSHGWETVLPVGGMVACKPPG